MSTPDRDDDPLVSWEYRDHQCHVYAADEEAPADAGSETVWAGYASSKLPDGSDDLESELHVPGRLTADEDGWIGFSVSEDDRDEAGTRSDVEELVDQLVELETTMDG